MTEIKIQGFRIVDDTNEKPYCVYVIQVRVNRRNYVVERRYSELHAMHVELRKVCPTSTYFPPKRIRSLQPKNIEKRRSALETYLQTMMKNTQSRYQILSFLGIRKSEEQSESNPDKTHNTRLAHQPVFRYKKDFIQESLVKSTLPDIITEGVLLGLYKAA